MRKSRFTEEQIIAILAEQERGEHKAFWGVAYLFRELVVLIVLIPIGLIMWA